MKIVITEEQYKSLMEFKSAELSCSYDDYEELSEYLGNKDERKIGNNTYIVRLSDIEIGIKLHDTYILKYDPTNVVIIDTGGWETPTTFGRIQTFLNCRGVRIFRKKNVSYITGSNGTFEYRDNIEVMKDGYIIQS
jgi:hypothetical protein